MAELTIEELKEKLVLRAKRQIEYSYDNVVDVLILNDFFDDSVFAIKNWRKLSDYEEILFGNYNSYIVKFIVRSYQEQGIEGQLVSNIGGDVKKFALTPLQEMLSNITQRV